MKNILYLFVSSFLVLACKTSNQTSTPMPIETPILKSKTIGGYFQAAGVNPVWSLEISEKEIQFQSGELEMNMPHVEPVRAMDANVKMYSVFVEKGEIKISIYQKSCSLANSSDDFSYEVKIVLKTNGDSKEIIGCGNYIADYRLYDIWALEEIAGKKVTVSDFTKEIPAIEINASTKTFSGYAGCNQINGKLFQERELLRFTSIASTRMACPAGNLEQAFLKALQSSTRYEIRDNRLFLSNPSGLKIVFRKVD